jgi:hypothetical protein
MFKLVFKRFQNSTIFEKLLLIVGISISIIGFWLINTTFYTEPIINWSFVSAVFLWLLLIFLVILTDSNESIKEELATVIREHIEETRLLKKEVTLLRNAISKRKK